MGSLMIFGGDVENFGLFGTGLVFRALDTGKAEQKLGCPQTAHFLVDMNREDPAQGMQPARTGIEARLFQP